MIRWFWLLKMNRGRITLFLLLLGSFPLAYLGGLSLHENACHSLGQVEPVMSSVQTINRPDVPIPDVLQTLGHHFKENAGQLTNPAVRYYYSQADFGVSFTDTGVVYRLAGEVNAIVTLKFEGATPIQPEGQHMYAHLSHYFRGNNPARWVTGVRSYAQVIYPEVYDGIDLVYYFTAEGLKYDLVLQPGADPGAIRFRYEGIERLTMDANGFLMVHTPAGPLRDQALYLYQDTPAGQQFIRGAFTLYDDTTFGFQITEPYSSLYPLIIDPLVWSTLLGSSGGDNGEEIAIDSANNIYITGQTEDAVTDFPTTPGTINETHNGGIYDVFVCKLSADGSSLLYSTFLGGSGDDDGVRIAVDSAYNAYITGWTVIAGTNFPTTPGAYDETHNGDFDVFVCKLSPDGSSLLYSTLLGGSGTDIGFAFALDGSDNVFVAGYTAESMINFPTTPGAINETHNGGTYDVFVCKLSADGSSLLYSTFLGGSGLDAGRGLAVDSANNVYVTGETSSTDFPIMPGAYDETHNGGSIMHIDVFICKLSADGSSLLYSTFLGGSGDEFGITIALDSGNQAYVTGAVEDAATDFPTTPGAINETHNGGVDVFVCKLSADGSSLLYSTFLGGSGTDIGFAFALDGSDNVFVAGYTAESMINFPTTPGAINKTHNGGIYDVFVCKLSADGSSLLYSTFLGGSGDDIGVGLAVDSTNNIYVFGHTEDAVTDFPTTPGAYDETHNGAFDVFVCKIMFMSPIINLISPVNESIHQSGTIIDLIITDDGNVSHVLYNWDGASNATLIEPYDLSLPSGDGQHILHIYANDTQGNWASKTYVFTTDDTGPTITLTSPANGTTSTAGLTIDLSITDRSGVSYVLYNWDGAPNITLVSPYDLSLPTGSGQHVLYVYANDTLGHWASRLYIFTTEAPTTTSGLDLLAVLQILAPLMILFIFAATAAFTLVLFVRWKRQRLNN
ncbi:MAG: SBBP repeat-containing protein [Promethearchaeota archaeon]